MDSNEAAFATQSSRHYRGKSGWNNHPESNYIQFFLLWPLFSSVVKKGVVILFKLLHSFSFLFFLFATARVANGTLFNIPRNLVYSFDGKKKEIQRPLSDYIIYGRLLTSYPYFAHAVIRRVRTSKTEARAVEQTLAHSLKWN